ncbi:MAG: carbon-nitrogen hydrolase family protein [Alphaproteobacteria bacterium]|nr:carbon-nitrogen hydrolase family protein [Alphaproteobacteria bacterium]
MKVACIQINSGPDIQNNLDKVDGIIRNAVVEGAEFVALPENTCHMRFPSEWKLRSAMGEDDHTAIPFFSKIANELGISLLVGSISIKLENSKLANRSYLFGSDGSTIATYDKIHLFDVDLANKESYKESKIVEPGDRAVTARLKDDFMLGLTICYDVRFAYLYRDLAKKGANIMAVPAAFTVPTGKAHWEVLLRARAIETGSYVIAPGQVGEHEGGRKTYGHSMIIDPWGKVLAEKAEGEGYIMADLDITKVNEARTAVPALRHDRDYMT